MRRAIRLMPAIRRRRRKVQAMTFFMRSRLRNLIPQLAPARSSAHWLQNPDMDEPELRLSKTSDTDASVTAVSGLGVKIKRSLHIINFAASLGGTSLDLTDQKGNIISFNRNVDEYWVTVERGSKAIWFQAEFPNTLDTTDCCGGYYALMDGARYDSLENVEFALGEDPG